MSGADPLWAAVLPVIDALDALGVENYIGGSVASSLQGVFRSTNDVDLVADLRREHVSALATALEPTHACDPTWIIRAIDQHARFNALHDETGFKVDVFVPVMTGFAARTLARRVAVTMPELGRSVWIASAEDVVLQKLHWFREGGETSERQWLDVLGVLKLQGESLDRGYLREWAATLGVSDLLELALLQAG